MKLCELAELLDNCGGRVKLFLETFGKKQAQLYPKFFLTHTHMVPIYLFTSIHPKAAKTPGNALYCHSVT